MDRSLPFSNRSTRTTLSILLLVGASIGIIFSIYHFLPVGQDWKGIRNATFEMLAGRSPFVDNIYNPPWVLMLLLPAAILPVKLGAALLSFLNLAVYGFAALRFGKSPWLAALLLITTAMFRQMIDPNLEFLVVLGLLLPPPLGIFLVLAKPQLGAFVAIFWVIEAWREGGPRQTVRLLAPITLVTLATIAMYGWWPLHGFGLIGSFQNVSMWPTSIIIGIPLIVYAIQTRQMNLALLSTLFLAPYYGVYSIHVPLLGLLPRRIITLSAVIGFWIAFWIGFQ